MPEPPAGPTAAEQARFATVTNTLSATTAAQAELPPPDSLTADARVAVTEPAAEAEARAEGSLILALDEQPQVSPEIEKLCLEIHDAIEKRRPLNEDQWVNTNPRALAADAAGSVQGSIQGDIEGASGQYSAIEETPPADPTEAAGPVADLPPAAETAPVNAAAAAPDAIPAEDVSLDADVQANRERLDGAGLNSPAAQLVTTGPVAEARQAQGELENLSATGPAEALAHQQEAIDSARSNMAELEARALAALTGARASSSASVASRQQGMVGSEEQMRATVGAEAQRIFDNARTEVTGLLGDLPGRAMDKYRAGTDRLTTAFQTELDRIRTWQDSRGGLTAWWQDKVAGWPDEIVAIFETAEANFGHGVCEVVRQISIEVNTVIATCEGIIAAARQQIEGLFASLPAELAGWAQQEQARLGAELSSLSEQAQAARTAINHDLATQARQAVRNAREQISALRDQARSLIGRFADAFGQLLDNPARAIINGLLSLVGIAPAAFWSVVERIGQVINDIADDPIGFAGNLLRGIGQGFRLFFDNLLGRLRDGFFDWLFGGLAAAGVNVPADFSLRSIITFILELMGITWPRIRTILARHIGEENVGMLERAYELISTLIAQGPEGIFEMIRERLNPQQILQQILDAALDYMQNALISAVVPRILLLFNPVGAIGLALQAIYRVLKWIFDNAARLFSLVETVVNGMADIVAGNVSGMAAAIDRALSRLIAPVIDFLAGYLGLGDLPDRIRQTIERFQGYIEGILDRVIGFLADRARALFRAMGGGGGEEEAESGLPGDAGALDEGITFTAEGETHRLYVMTNGSDEVLMMNSEPQPVSVAINDFKTNADATTEDDIEPAAAAAKQLVTQIDAKSAQLRSIRDGGNQEQAAALKGEIEQLENDLATHIKTLLAIPSENMGTKQNPYKLPWPKPAAARYPSIYIGPLTSDRLSQASLIRHYSSPTAASAQAIESQLEPLNETEAAWLQNPVVERLDPLQGGSIAGIGIGDKYRLAVGSLIEMKSTSRSRGGGLINRALRPYGYTATAAGYDGDHVLEMQLGGPNSLDNLWPLDASLNRGAGPTIAALEFPGAHADEDTMDEIKKKVKDNKGPVWFRIVSTNG